MQRRNQETFLTLLVSLGMIGGSALIAISRGKIGNLKGHRIVNKEGNPLGTLDRRTGGRIEVR